MSRSPKSAASNDQNSTPDAMENSTRRENSETRLNENSTGYPGREGLDAIQLRAIELLVQGLPDAEVARRLTIGRNTLWRWRTDDEGFQIALNKAREDIHTNALDRYQALLEKATQVLAGFMEDAPPHFRLRAAQTILHMSGNFRPTTISDPQPSFEAKVG